MLHATGQLWVGRFRAGSEDPEAPPSTYFKKVVLNHVSLQKDKQKTVHPGTCE